MIENDTNAPAAAIFYKDLLSDIKRRVRKAQSRLATFANTELLALYWDIGRLLVDRQKMEGWGAGVLRRLATDLKNELTNQQGYSERNLKLMTQFYREYPGLFEIGQQPVAQLPDTIASHRMNSGQDNLIREFKCADRQCVSAADA